MAKPNTRALTYFLLMKYRKAVYKVKRKQIILIEITDPACNNQSDLEDALQLLIKKLDPIGQRVSILTNKGKWYHTDAVTELLGEKPKIDLKALKWVEEVLG